MNTLKELVAHMKNYKDAVIIVGSGINPHSLNYTTEEFNEKYNRKSLVRNYEETMAFYADNIEQPINDIGVYELIKEIDHSLILDQNINGSIAASYLHGHVNIFKCIKCKTVFPIEGLMGTTCECCGANLRPSVLLAGERYDQVLFDEFKEKLLNTHTVFLIGMDFNEDALLNLIADYGDMKAQLNAEGKEERVLISIQEKDLDFNPNEITHFEFLVKDDVKNALARFITAYES